MRKSYVIKSFAKETYLSYSEGGTGFKVIDQDTILFRFSTKEDAADYMTANFSDLDYEIIPVYHNSSRGRIQV